MDGEIRSVNRSFYDLVGVPFHKSSKTLEELSGGQWHAPELVRRAMPRFLERRVGPAIAEVRPKITFNFLFRLHAHAMVRNDESRESPFLPRHHRPAQK